MGEQGLATGPWQAAAQLSAPCHGASLPSQPPVGDGGQAGRWDLLSCAVQQSKNGNWEWELDQGLPK